MVNALPLKSISSRALEYVYVCVSDQMPGAYKVGETHRQSPEQRARQFTGVDRRVTWRVLRAFTSPDSRATEKLVHARLIALGAQVAGYREIFTLGQTQLLSIIEECVARTSTQTQQAIPRSELVVIPLEAGPWAAALSMPVAYGGEKDLTLARILALAAAGNFALQRKLLEQGFKLVYPNPEQPHFRIHSLEGTKWSTWLKTQGISWADLGIPEGGLHRKVKCKTVTGL